MANSFSCPNCGGTLEYPGTGRTMKCTYCGTTVDVPAEIWQPLEAERTTNQWKKYIVIFLLITVGLPTCVGLLGTLLGIGGTIFAMIVPFVLRLFLR